MSPRLLHGHVRRRAHTSTDIYLFTFCIHDVRTAQVEANPLVFGGTSFESNEARSRSPVSVYHQFRKFRKLLE